MKPVMLSQARQQPESLPGAQLDENASLERTLENSTPLFARLPDRIAATGAQNRIPEVVP